MNARRKVEIGHSAIDANSRTFVLEVVEHEVRNGQRDRFVFMPISRRQEREIHKYLNGANPDFKDWFDAELEKF